MRVGTRRRFSLWAVLTLLAALLPVLTAAPAQASTKTIMEIQGDGQFSHEVGNIVTTSGVVTAVSANGRDMWIQDPNGDGDPATSDGIMVDDRDKLPNPKPVVGDSIIITGQVEELQFGNALPLTRLDDPDDFTPYQIVSNGNPLPAPVELSDLPNLSVSDATDDFFEPVEGMRVSVENARVVGPTNRFGEFVMLAKKDAKVGSGFFPQTQQILLRSIGVNVVDYNPERIMVDDSTVDDPIEATPGDVVRSLVGVMDYTFSNYKIQPTSFDVFNHSLPSAPVSTRSGPNGNTVITSFNVENLFDLVHEAGTTVDVIGRIGEDPGSEWSGGGIGTKDETLRRKGTICSGDNDGSDVFDPSVEWAGFAQNTFGGLGSHTVTCGTATGLFFSEYVEGSSFNKAVEIYNGTGSAVDLSLGRWAVEIYFNGATEPSEVIQLSGTIADDDVYVLTHSSGTGALTSLADQLSGDLNFNGDDAVVLCQGCKDDRSSTPSASELETQLTKLALAIEVELELPEIIVVQEVENTAILQELGDRVNSAAGTDYVATSFETSDGRGIEVGFLWDDDRVDLIDAFQLSGTDVQAAFGHASASSGREPLYGTFNVNGEVVNIVGNHFKSKGGDDPIFGISFNRVTETQRKLQAQVVRDFIDGFAYGAKIMVTGDLNDFQFGEPGEGSDHPVAILEGAGGSDPLTNLINEEKEAERWTFVFDGNSQVLDHMLVNDALLDSFVAADVLHFNAGYPASAGEDGTTTIRASDHEAVEGRFDL